jgi:hypothetical protein
MKMNRKLLTVLAALVILGAAAGCNKKNDAALTETNDKQETTQAKTSGKAGGYDNDYPKVLKGDLSDFAGNYWGLGGGLSLRPDGIVEGGFLNEKWVANNFRFEKTDGSYRWNINTGSETYFMILYPVGVDIYTSRGELIERGGADVHLAMTSKDGPYVDDILTQDTNGKIIGPPPDLPGPWERVGGKWQRIFNNEHYEELLKGNLFNFSGPVRNDAGKWNYLNSSGTFADGQTASGFTRQNNPKQASGGDFYMWGINADGGGFAAVLFPPGVDVMGYEGIIPTDKTKVRLTMGQDLPSSSAEVFYLDY